MIIKDLLKFLTCLLIVFSIPACVEYGYDEDDTKKEQTSTTPDDGSNTEQDDEIKEDEPADGENGEDGEKEDEDSEGENNEESEEDDNNNNVEDNGDSTLEHTIIAVPNGDFEEYVDFTGNQGAWKQGYAWYTNRATFTYLEDGGVNNSACIKISCTGAQTTDAPALQTISGLTIGVPYELSADIKTEGVENGRGGSIGIFDASGFIASGSYIGTNDWSNRKVLFIPETETIDICCRLGFWAGDSRGTVWFDNVKLQTLSDIYTREGEHVVLYIRQDLVTVSNSIVDEWLSDLDKAYEAYCELFSFFKPYDGKKMPILSNEVSAWAIAGYPIQWNPGYITSTLKDVEKYDDSVFGILHEIAHNFGPDNYTSGTHKYGNNNWNWNEELFANFRMYYALEKHNMRIYTDGKVFTGTELGNDKYKKDSENSWAKNKDLDGAGMMWPLCQMVAEVGWEPFKKAFEELYKLNPDLSFGSSKWEKIKYFLDTVSKHADQDMLSFLTTEQQNKLKNWN